MAKIYTAQEMREAAKGLFVNEAMGRRDGGDYIMSAEIIAMLRQAADFMERKEKREYEYKVAKLTRDGKLFEEVVVRRKVGELEEVPNV